jgi:hypothetical protein
MNDRIEQAIKSLQKFTFRSKIQTFQQGPAVYPMIKIVVYIIGQICSNSLLLFGKTTAVYVNVFGLRKTGF